MTPAQITFLRTQCSTPTRWGFGLKPWRTATPILYAASDYLNHLPSLESHVQQYPTKMWHVTGSFLALLLEKSSDLDKSLKRPVAKYNTVNASQIEWESDAKFQQKLMPCGHSLTQHHASSIPILLQTTQTHYNISVQ